MQSHLAGWISRLCICPRVLWGYRVAEAKEELAYSLLRARFIFPSRPAPGGKELPSDFDFSSYLRTRCVHAKWAADY